MTFRTRLVVFLISTPILAFAVIGGFLGRADAQQDGVQHLRVFEDVVSLILNNYVEEAEFDKVMEGAMIGLADGLDADSAYLRPEEVRLVESGQERAPAGIGIELTRQYYLRIIAARDGSVAARAGLATGDYIRAIDGKSTRDMSVFTGSRLLRGAPGTKVALTILRGSAAEPHPVELVRERDAAVEPSTRIVRPGVGYVRIPAFHARVPERLKDQIAALSRQGIGHLILDVRRTAEGDWTAGVQAARLFVGSGTVAEREARGQSRQTEVASAGDGAVKLPVTLLINGGTAGPAELFVAALAGNKRAELIGDRTVGRAALQKLIKLPDGSGLWLSWARYLRPAGAPLHGRGIDPDVEVEEPDADFGAQPSPHDPVLEKALERVGVRKVA